MKLIAQEGIGTIKPPDQISNIANRTGAEGVSAFINLLLTLIISVSAVIFVFMIVWGGFQWITSGGDKEKVKNARSRITHAVIGITIVSLAFVIAKTVGDILGLHIV